SVSIIVPCRNDAAALRRTLDCLAELEGFDDGEVLVAASGNPDGTTSAAAGRARVIWPGRSTRAALMNAGAKEARGNAVFFVHAPSVSSRPVPALVLPRAPLSDRGVGGGASNHQSTAPRLTPPIISGTTRGGFPLPRRYYGDQGIFVRAPVFRRIGGYRDLAL